MGDLPIQIKLAIELIAGTAVAVANYFLLKQSIAVLKERLDNCREGCKERFRTHAEDNNCNFLKNREDHKRIHERIDDIMNK